MRAEAAIFAASLALALAGCSLRGNPNTAQAAPPTPAPAAKPAPSLAPQTLSVPQTRVQLPAPQPLDPDALAAVDAEPQPVEQPAAPSNTTRRAPGTRVVATPRAADPPSPAPATAEPEPRQPVQEVMSPDQKKILQDAAEQRKRDAKALLDQATRGHSLTAAEKKTAQSIEQLLRSSEDSAAKGDMQTASELANKALILARDLQNGR